METHILNDFWQRNMRLYKLNLHSPYIDNSFLAVLDIFSFLILKIVFL